MRTTFTIFAVLLLLGQVQGTPRNELASLRTSRHVELGVETLVPVTQASVWLSNCKPTSDTKVSAILAALDQSSLDSIPWAKFSVLHVRAVIYDPPRIVYVDAGLRLKIIESDKVRYVMANKSSTLAGAIREAFDQCL
jgi:hypothetical protein